MNDQFGQMSQEYIGQRISGASFDLDGGDEFIKIDEPYVLKGIKYQVYDFKYLTGYKPNKAREEVVKYNFVVLKPLDGVKEKFVEEVNKQQQGQPFDENIVGDYYAPFMVGDPEFDKFYQSLAKMLGEEVFGGKGYVFGLHTVTVTSDMDPVLVFAEVKSFTESSQAFDATGVFDPEG